MSKAANTDRHTASSSEKQTLMKSMMRHSTIVSAIGLLGLVTVGSTSVIQVNAQKTRAPVTTNDSVEQGKTLRLTAEDKLEIIELTARHDRAIDTWNLNEYADTFADDAVQKNPRGSFRGKAAIRKGLESYEANAKGNRHHSLGHVITANADDTATMTSNFLTIKATNSTKQDVPYVLSHSVMNDRLRKVNGAWKFQRREQTQISTRPQPW